MSVPVAPGGSFFSFFSSVCKIKLHIFVLQLLFFKTIFGINFSVHAAVASGSCFEWFRIRGRKWEKLNECLYQRSFNCRETLERKQAHYQTKRLCHTGGSVIYSTASSKAFSPYVQCCVSGNPTMSLWGSCDSGSGAGYPLIRGLCFIYWLFRPRPLVCLCTRYWFLKMVP